MVTLNEVDKEQPSEQEQLSPGDPIVSPDEMVSPQATKEQQSDDIQVNPGEQPIGSEDPSAP